MAEFEHEEPIASMHHELPSRGIFHGIERRLDELTVLQGVGVAALAVLALDWVVAPKGKSVIGQAFEKLAPGGAPPPPHMLPPGAHFAGANLHSGFGHGYMPYGGWAHADPGGPSQYAHAAQHGLHGMGTLGAGWYDWE